MKKLSLLLAVGLSGCAWVHTHQTQINATGSLLAQKAGSIALKVILAAATSQHDSDSKANYLDSAAAGLRAEMPNIVTADDLQSVISVWTPGTPHWQYLGSELGSAFNQTSGPSDQRLEAIASGLNVAAAKERAE